MTGRFDSKVTSPEVQKLIPIRGSATTVPTRGAHVDPYQFWSDYYKTHDESGEQLRETLRILNASGKPQDVYAAISGYLTHHRKNQETWMYEAAAMAIEMNKGKPEEVKKYLGYAADLAQRSHNPNDLISVADKLYLKGYYDRIGPLLDEAATKIPHRAEPFLMSINLSQKTKDPVRMARSIQGLLSLGWPGSDEYFRQQSRKEAESLANTLREEGRGKEADTLLSSLPEAEARDLYIRLSWSGDAAYDLIVEEPLGAKASYTLPRTVFGGSILNDGHANHPEEVYVCPRAFDGQYTIRVEQTYADPVKPLSRLTLDIIMHEGTPKERKQSFTLDPKRLDQPTVVKFAGGRRKTVLPFVNPLAAFEPALEAQRKKLAAAAKKNAEAQAKGEKGDPSKSAKSPRSTIKVK